MSILSDFFIAEGTDVPDYEGGEAVAAEDKLQLRRITSLEAAGMLAAIRGLSSRKGLSREFELLTEPEAEEWTFSVPSDMVEKLATIPKTEFGALAQAFAESTAEELGWQQADFLPVVEGLSDLSQRARESGKQMYLWNCV